MKKLIKPIEILLAVAAALVGLGYGIKRFALRTEMWIADRGEDVVSDVPDVQADETS